MQIVEYKGKRANFLFLFTYSFIYLFTLFSLSSSIHHIYPFILRHFPPSYLLYVAEKQRKGMKKKEKKDDANGRRQGKTSQCLMSVAFHPISSHAAVVGEEEDPQRSHLRGLPTTGNVQEELEGTNMII